MPKGSNQESEQMMLLLQELAALKKGEMASSAPLKRRKEIGWEIKKVAAEKKQQDSKESTAE